MISNRNTIKQIKTGVDIYGACGPFRCARSSADKCFSLLVSSIIVWSRNDEFTWISQFQDNDYKFYLAFENSNCQDYITEKFFVNGLGWDHRHHDYDDHQLLIINTMFQPRGAANCNGCSSGRLRASGSFQVLHPCWPVRRFDDGDCGRNDFFHAIIDTIEKLWIEA